MVIVTFSGPSFKLEQIMAPEEVRGFIESLKTSGIEGDFSITKV